MMAVYFAGRIEKGKLKYNAVVKKYPQFKDEIDEILVADGYEIDEKGNCVKVSNTD